MARLNDACNEDNRVGKPVSSSAGVVTYLVRETETERDSDASNDASSGSTP